MDGGATTTKYSSTSRTLEDESPTFDGSYTLTNIAFTVDGLKGKFDKDARNAFISAMNNEILSYYIIKNAMKYEGDVRDNHCHSIRTRHGR